MTARTRPVAPRSRVPWIIAGALGVGVLGLGGWWAYNEYIAPGDAASTKVVTPAPGDAARAIADDAAAIGAIDGAVATTTPDAGGNVGGNVGGDVGGDAAAVAVTTGDAGVAPGAAAPGDAAPGDAAPGDAAAVAVAPPGDAGVKPAVDGQLAITSTPGRARVFLDGADVGTTPLELPGSPDRHTIAVLLSGHELYVAQVDGQGSFEIPLKEVTPSGGPAGIKVIRCKDKERYYVFVDGKATGMTCPTERIEVQLGPHTVEVYDVVTDSRRKFDIVVKDTRLSHRVRIE